MVKLGVQSARSTYPGPLNRTANRRETRASDGGPRDGRRRDPPADPATREDSEDRTRESRRGKRPRCTLQVHCTVVCPELVQVSSVHTIHEVRAKRRYLRTRDESRL